MTSIYYIHTTTIHHSMTLSLLYVRCWRLILFCVCGQVTSPSLNCLSLTHIYPVSNQPFSRLTLCCVCNQGVSQIFTGYYYPMTSNAGELLLLLGVTLLVFLVERDFVLAGSFAGGCVNKHIILFLSTRLSTYPHSTLDHTLCISNPNPLFPQIFCAAATWRSWKRS